MAPALGCSHYRLSKHCWLVICWVISALFFFSLGRHQVCVRDARAQETRVRELMGFPPGDRMPEVFNKNGK